MGPFRSLKSSLSSGAFPYPIYTNPSTWGVVKNIVTFYSRASVFDKVGLVLQPGERQLDQLHPRIRFLFGDFETEDGLEDLETVIGSDSDAEEQ